MDKEEIEKAKKQLVDLSYWSDVKTDNKDKSIDTILKYIEKLENDNYAQKIIIAGDEELKAIYLDKIKELENKLGSLPGLESDNKNFAWEIEMLRAKVKELEEADLTTVYIKGVADGEEKARKRIKDLEEKIKRERGGKKEY